MAQRLTKRLQIMVYFMAFFQAWSVTLLRSATWQLIISHGRKYTYSVGNISQRRSFLSMSMKERGVLFLGTWTCHLVCACVHIYAWAWCWGWSCCRAWLEDFSGVLLLLLMLMVMDFLLGGQWKFHGILRASIEACGDYDDVYYWLPVIQLLLAAGLVVSPHT